MSASQNKSKKKLVIQFEENKQITKQKKAKTPNLLIIENQEISKDNVSASTFERDENILTKTTQDSIKKYCTTKNNSVPKSQKSFDKNFER